MKGEYPAGAAAKFVLLSAAGVILCFMLILRLSLYIWDISVFGSYTHTPEQITGFLRENGIAAGKAKSEIDCAGIEALLRSAFEDIGWVSAEIKGTRLIIRISETNLTDTNPPSAGPQHIVAEKDGIVRQIVVRSGTPMVAAISTPNPSFSSPNSAAKDWAGTYR